MLSALIIFFQTVFCMRAFVWFDCVSKASKPMDRLVLFLMAGGALVLAMYLPDIFERMTHDK